MHRLNQGSYYSTSLEAHSFQTLAYINQTKLVLVEKNSVYTILQRNITGG